jgi:hypothetical protein
LILPFGDKVATEEEVREFLNDFRLAAVSPRGLILLRIYEGSRNSDGILSLGITETEAKEQVFGLRVEDYSSGPEEDRDRTKQKIWKFAPIISGYEIYVKLVLTDDRRAKVLSFHPADYPMPRPFSRRERR